MQDVIVAYLLDGLSKANHIEFTTSEPRWLKKASIWYLMKVMMGMPSQLLSNFSSLVDMMTRMMIKMNPTKPLFRIYPRAP